MFEVYYSLFCRLKYIIYHFVDLILLIKCEKQLVPSPLPLAWCAWLSYWSSLDKVSQALFFSFNVVCMLFFLDSRSSSSSCFSKWRRKCFAEGRASAAKSGTIPPPSLVTVWGIQSKVCPVTCSSRNKQPAESPKTKAIRGGRLVCELNRGTFLKASIMEKLLVVAVESD